MGCACSQEQDEEDVLYATNGSSLNESELNENEDRYRAEEGETLNAQSTDHDDMFKSYAEIAEQETNRRATHINQSIDIFSRTDIRLLPNVEGNFGKIDNEESGEYIITYWSRQFEETLFIPLVICDLIVTFIDMVYRSRWSNQYKGPDFKINILNKSKATITNKYAMKQMIRAINCCLRGKVSVFYIIIDGLFDSLETRNNFIGVVHEYEDSFNLPLPHEGYGILFESGKIYKGNTIYPTRIGEKVINKKKVKCVVDLRENRHLFKCLWSSNETVIKLPDKTDNENYKDIKWYPCISGNFANMSCIIEFDEFSTPSNSL